jgi:hypothetical protein
VQLLQKPIAPADLVAAIDSTLFPGRPAAPRVSEKT